MSFARVQRNTGHEARSDTRREARSDNESEDKDTIPFTVRGKLVNEWLKERNEILESTFKALQSEIRLLKSSNARKTKHQLRVDYDWDGENANLSDKVSNWVKTYLFPRYKFLKDGWMAYDNEHDSLSSFVQKKMNMEEEDDFQGLWERVIRQFSRNTSL